MHIYHQWHGLKERHHNLVVGLGNFDGVHIGHQKLISELVTMAKEIEGTSAVFTFNPHPLTVLSPENCPPQLLSQESKQKLIVGMGVEVLLLAPFDLEFSRIFPEDFVRIVLFEELGARCVVVGYNYAFGYRGQGTPALLEELSAGYGYKVRVIPPVMIEGQSVSSTHVRNLIMEGEVAEAAKFLGYNPFMEGQVVAGDKRGRTLGFPTANLEIDQSLLVPANGVYLAAVDIDDNVYAGVANIGTKPTFQGTKRNIEVHLLDFSQDLYEKQIKISFTRRLRGEKKFASPSELIRQITHDVSEARSELSRIGV